MPRLFKSSNFFTGRVVDGPLQFTLAWLSIHPGGIPALVTRKDGHLEKWCSRVHKILSEIMAKRVRGDILNGARFTSVET